MYINGCTNTNVLKNDITKFKKVKYKNNPNDFQNFTNIFFIDVNNANIGSIFL